MVQLTYTLFLCLLVPLILMLFILESRSRMVFIFMLIGMLTCLVAGEFNAVILNYSDRPLLYATVTYTPILEELLKGLPILYCALFITQKRERLLSASMAVGIGFAIYENIGIIIREVDGVSLDVVLIRGFATALAHGICTSMIGYGLSLIYKRRKLAIPGTFGLLTAAVTYHAIFNALMQSDYKIVACILPLATYIPAVVFNIRSRRSKGHSIKDTA